MTVSLFYIICSTRFFCNSKNLCWSLRDLWALLLHFKIVVLQDTMQDEKEEKKLSPVVLVQEVKSYFKDQISYVNCPTLPDIQVLFLIHLISHSCNPSFFCYELPCHSFKIFLFTEFTERNLLESCLHFVLIWL